MQRYSTLSALLRNKITAELARRIRAFYGEQITTKEAVQIARDSLEKTNPSVILAQPKMRISAQHEFATLNHVQALFFILKTSTYETQNN